MKFDVEVFADYYQFYVQDGVVEPSAALDWTDEDIEHRAKVSENLVVICPLRNMEVPVSVEIHASNPLLDWNEYDHVVQCGLALPSGVLQIHECTGGEVLRINIDPGCYDVLAMYGGLDAIDDHGLEGDDFYRIALWPAAEVEPLRVLKSWAE